MTALLPTLFLSRFLYAVDYPERVYDIGYFKRDTSRAPRDEMNYIAPGLRPGISDGKQEVRRWTIFLMLIFVRYVMSNPRALLEGVDCAHNLAPWKLHQGWDDKFHQCLHHSPLYVSLSLFWNGEICWLLLARNLHNCKDRKAAMPDVIFVMASTFFVDRGALRFSGCRSWCNAFVVHLFRPDLISSNEVIHGTNYTSTRRYVE